MYQIKKGEESFEIVDGPLAGHRFERGKTYSKAPAGYRRKFKKIKADLKKKEVEKLGSGEIEKKKKP